MTGAVTYALIAVMSVSCEWLGGTPARRDGGRVQKRTAEISNSGSTNFAGYRIVVSESAHVKYIPGKGRPPMGAPAKEIEVDISKDLVKKLFADIDQAGPLSKLPTGHCMKSASFGTRTYVKAGDERSPDVSCTGQDPRTEALYADEQAIFDAVKAASSH